MANTFTRIFLAALATAVLCAGCADKTAHKPDQFFDQWKLKAEESRGHSPDPNAPPTTVKSISTTTLDKMVQENQANLRPLPQNRITLKLQNADVSTVLRALAKAASQPILMNSNIKGDLTVNVDNQPWEQVFKGILRNQGLTYSWEGNLIRVMGLDDMKKENDIEQIQNDRLAKRRDSAQLEAMQTTLIGVKYAEAKSLKPNLEALLTKDKDGKPRGSVVVDEPNNAIVVQAIREDSQKAIKLVENLDRPRSQIALRAYIVEATKDTARDLGVQWGGYGYTSADGKGNRMFLSGGGKDGKWVKDAATEQIVWQPTSTLGTGGFGSAYGFNYPADTAGGIGTQLNLAYGILSGKILETQLSALQKDGKVNILSSPSITTLDNQTAYTENGERVPFVATTPEGKLEVKFEDAVLRLEITPHVIDTDNLRLRVLVKKDEVDTSRNVQGNPYIIKKMTETNLITINKETIVISGLSRDRSSDNSSGVPGVDEVPVLGNMFRRDTKAKHLEEVLIFITPEILPYRSTAEVEPKPVP